MSEVTRLLNELRCGNRSAEAQLIEVVYDELRRIAAAHRAMLRSGDTLQATAVVNEAWLRLAGQDDWNSRAHFYGAAARAIRNVLVDHARGRARLKRGDGLERITLDVELMSKGEKEIDLVELDDALCRLEQIDRRKAEVVQLRFFSGLSIDETADVLGVSPSSVDRMWSFARAWLRREMSG